MTTAMPPSARPGIRRGGPLEQGEDRLQLQTEVLDRLGRQGAPGLRLQLARATVLLDFLARALDRVFLRVQEVLDQHDQLDLASLVHPVARPVLGRVEEAELTLPVAQHVGLQVGELADLADRKELLDRIWDAHSPPPPPPPHCSAFSSRSIRSPTALRRGLPLNSTAPPCSAIGTSPRCSAPRRPAARAVLTPSATEAPPGGAGRADTTRPTAWSRAAATTALGSRWYPSCANEGPDSTASCAPRGRTSPSTQEGVAKRSGSSPFDTLTTSAPRRNTEEARAITSRTTWDGADETTTSASRTTLSRSPLARRVGPRVAPGRNTWLTCSRLMLSTTSGSRAHNVTDSTPPLRASRSASAVPQAPPPTTAILVTGVRGSRHHSFSRPEPILGAVDQPPNVGSMRVHDQQRERHAGPEAVRRGPRGRSHRPRNTPPHRDRSLGHVTE